jgi:hypothetical protein
MKNNQELGRRQPAAVELPGIVRGLVVAYHNHPRFPILLGRKCEYEGARF